MNTTKTLILAVVLLLSVSAVWAGEDDPVYFADGNLKQAIKDRLGITTDPTEGEMATLTYLFAENRGITNLTGIEYALILERLNLSGNQISDISPLAGLANLIVLRLPSNQISNLSPLSALTKLITLTLESNQISSVSALSPLTNLTSLTLWNNQIQDISALAPLTQLTRLDLDNNQIGSIGTVAGFTELNQLGLGDNQIQDISALSGLTQLTRLDLPGNQIADIDALAGLTTLTRLTLGYNQISDISALSALTNLTLLTLYYNQIEDISALAGMTALTRLELQYNPIHDISPLTGLTTLETIKVKGCPLSWESYCLWGPVILANNPNLTDVRIDPNPYNCGCAPAPTPEGSSVIVTPTDNTTGTSPVTLTFEYVTESGGTTLVTSESGPTPPSGFQLGDPATYYDITTTATYSGLIEICISYIEGSYIGPEELLRLYHYAGGSWVDCTTLVDTENNIIYGEVTSLSAFAILMPEAPVFQSLTASPNILWPPNHKMTPITVTCTVLDDSDPSPIVKLKNITMNEGDEISTYDPIFDNTQGDGHTTTDIQIKDGVIYLRAERSGTGTGRVYTLTYEATDSAGNVGTASVTVTVPHEAP
jgi:Leucine-rich repeat (LRR) protein